MSYVVGCGRTQLRLPDELEHEPGDDRDENGNRKMREQAVAAVDHRRNFADRPQRQADQRGDGDQDQHFHVFKRLRLAGRPHCQPQHNR